MKLSRLSIRNFKTIKKIDIDFQRDISLIVGKNNIGKSNVLKALGLFFQNLNTFDNEQGVFETEDYRKNTVYMKLEATFTGIKNQISKLQNDRIEESKKKRSNQETIRTLEQSINILELFCNKKDEITITLTIDREGKKTIIPSSFTSPSFEKFKEKTLNMYFVQSLQKSGNKDLLNKTRAYQQNTPKKWFDYNWLIKDGLDLENGKFDYTLKLDIETDLSEKKKFKVDSKVYNNEISESR